MIISLGTGLVGNVAVAGVGGRAVLVEGVDDVPVEVLIFFRKLGIKQIHSNMVVMFQSIACSQQKDHSEKVPFQFW